MLFCGEGTGQTGEKTSVQQASDNSKHQQDYFSSDLQLPVTSSLVIKQKDLKSLEIPEYWKHKSVKFDINGLSKLTHFNTEMLYMTNASSLSLIFAQQWLLISKHYVSLSLFSSSG